MIFRETGIENAWLITLEPIQDERGFFARCWCSREFKAHGLSAAFLQSNLSYNHRRGTLRGMHYQAPPHAEEKLVRCTRGAVFDVLIDLRRDSSTYGQWYGARLSEGNHQALYIPKGCAHGYLTLEDETAVLYEVSQLYQPWAERGVRFDDPLVGIEWPEPVRIVSAKDARWPLLSDRCSN